ncbi:metal ABC transporter solute-binding protein, Zn/Mn family [Congregicoccus parvus]|uniref:metal ABC transporter solute-binding protein, Zn/Mn family n=1 Tax=Congregicoccus parvus TaxID=3081749 RepID=UPI003FA52AF1
MASLVAPSLQASSRPRIVTTNTILADIAAHVAGPSFEVHCLVPVGADLHGFEPRPADVARLTGAVLVVANGAGFEPWLEKMLASSGYDGARVTATTGVQLLHASGEPCAHGHTHEHSHGHGHDPIDPHAWQDPVNGIRYALNIRDALVPLAPERQAEIENRTRLYIAQLEMTHAWMRRIFAAIPEEQRRIVTSHDAFAYLGRACGLEILPMRGLDSRQEPDARHVADLVEQLRAGKVRAIFVEAVSNPKMLEQLARDTGVALGGELFSDSLGPAGSGADTYLGLLRENALAIATAVSGR